MEFQLILLLVIYTINFNDSSALTLGGLVVACLPMDPRFASSNLAKGNEFLRAIKFHCMTSFGGQLKPSVPYHKNPRSVKRDAL